MIGPAILFCPGDRPDRFGKAAIAADVVILDLEDAVAADGKTTARENVRVATLDPLRTYVRVNAAETPHQALDLAAISATPFRSIVLPKAESPAQVTALVDRIGPDISVMALIETAAGVLHAAVVAAHPNVTSVMWGSEDLTASLGGRSSRDAAGRLRPTTEHARAAVLIAAAAHAKAVIDTVFVDISNVDGLNREATEAAEMGFVGKACIHPSQAPLIRAAFAPDAKQRDWAQRVLAAARQERGVFSFEGRMIDAPVLRQAERIVAASPHSAQTGSSS